MREEHFPAYFAQLDRLRFISNIELISLSQEQVETALAKLAESEEIKLSKLSLNWSNSSSAVLSRALVKIEEVVVKSTFSSTETAVRSLEDLCGTIVRCEDLKTRKLNIVIGTTNSDPDSDLPPPSVSPELLSAALVRLVKIDIDFIMNSEQLEALATKIAQEKNMKLEILRLNGNNELDQVSPEVLSRAIIRLKKMPSQCNRGRRIIMKLSSLQIEFLLKALYESKAGEVNLEYLGLGKRSLTDVPPDYLAGAAVKVKTVKFSCCHLTTDQSKALLTRIAASAEKIKTKFLDIRRNDLSSVPADILVKTIEKLDKIELINTNLTKPQMTAVLKQFVKKSSFRRKVGGVFGLSSDQVLSTVSGELLGQSIAMLKSVRLPKEFSSDQVSSVLSRVAERNWTKHIVFQCDLTSVSSDLLARVVLNMETIRFQQDASLSSDQAKAIFDTLAASTSLRSFIPTNEHADLSPVDPRVLSEVLVKLDSVRLHKTLLTTEQLQVLFLKIAEIEDFKLKNLQISEIDLSSIPVEVLSKALLRVKCVYLRKTILTPEQVYDVYWSIILAQKMKLEYLDVGPVWSIVTPNVFSEVWSKMRLNSKKNSINH